MRKELEDKITADFPFMARQKCLSAQKAEGRISDLYGRYGLSGVGDGWFSLVYSMCQEISDIYKKSGADVDIKPAQLKEKFGQLRAYFDFEGQEKLIHAVDILGLFSIRTIASNNPLHKEVLCIIKKYEEKSYTVCENCGSKGELRTDLPWIKTLCDTCYSVKREKYNK